MNLEKHVAALGAHTALVGLIVATRDTYRCAVISVPDTHAFKVVGVQHVVLVVVIAAGRRLACGAQLAGAGARVGLRVHDGEVRVRAARVAGCARREAPQHRVLSEARWLLDELYFLGDGRLAVAVVPPADGKSGGLDDPAGLGAPCCNATELCVIWRGTHLQTCRILHDCSICVP